MPQKSNANQAGWFYHAPPRPNPHAEPVGAPPASQIPGLSDLSQQPPELQKALYIRDTDTDYIKLAKMGGRQDLLRMRSPKPKSEKAKPYPKVDWYYQDDITMENDDKEVDSNHHDNSNEDPYQFMLPDYMVHERQRAPPMQTSTQIQFEESEPRQGDDRYKPKRLPYADDVTTVYQRDGEQGVRDKNAAIPEERKAGYGVRADKRKDQQQAYSMPQRERGKAPASEMQQDNKGRFKYDKMPDDNKDKDNMSKVLSFGYAKDWEKKHDDWEVRQNKIRDKFDQKTNEKLQTEYQERMGDSRGQKTQYSPKKAERTQESGDQNKRTSKKEEEEKELFKMSRFKNVPARTVSHRQDNQCPVHSGAN